ncbi:MAG: DUF5666 domain-containing protein [Chloroflexota bacterium]
MKRILTISILVVTVLVVMAAMAAVAFTAYAKSSTAQAQGSQGMPPGGQGLQAPGQNPGPGGEVIAVGADSLTIRALNGETLVIRISAGTSIRLAESNQPGALSDIQVGSRVRVKGRPDQAGAIQAEVIVVLPEGVLQPGAQPGGPGGLGGQPGQLGPGVQTGPGKQNGPAALTGEVSALTDNSVTLQIQNGKELRVGVSDTTRVEVVESGEPGSLDDIQVGERLRVQLRPDQGDTLEAQLVLILPQGEEVGGEVVAVDGNSITLKNLRGEVTILVNEETRFRNGPGAKNTASLADITLGKPLVVYGDLREDGVLIAHLVMITNGPRPGGMQGPGAAPGGVPLPGE